MGGNRGGKGGRGNKSGGGGRGAGRGGGGGGGGGKNTNEGGRGGQDSRKFSVVTEDSTATGDYNDHVPQQHKKKKHQSGNQHHQHADPNAEVVVNTSAPPPPAAAAASLHTEKDVVESPKKWKKNGGQKNNKQQQQQQQNPQNDNTTNNKVTSGKNNRRNRNRKKNKNNKKEAEQQRDADEELSAADENHNILQEEEHKKQQQKGGIKQGSTTKNNNKNQQQQQQQQEHNKRKTGMTKKQLQAARKRATAEKHHQHAHARPASPSSCSSERSSSSTTASSRSSSSSYGSSGSSRGGGGDDSGEDYSDTANERKKEYRKGGYHPVHVGEVYNERYRVVSKLGWGYFSTVWLTWDYEGKAFHAMKVQKSAQHYREAAFDEIKLLSQIMNADDDNSRCCARMVDYFEHIGPHGTHVCMIFNVLGENLLCLMEKYQYKGIPIPIVKAITQQVLIGLEHIHSIDILHTDLKPENVLLTCPKNKILSKMKNYKPQPRHENLSLLSKDPKMMTKSQRKRYHKKLRELKEAGKELPAEVLAHSSAAGAAQIPAAQATGEEDSPQKKKTEEEGTAAAATEDATAEAGSDATGTETDPEWEIDRYHRVCLADFGNSCWTYKQFTDEVQTRQYRAPEVILGDGYSTPIDLWSCACMIFELLTGEFLFDPKQGDDYSRDEDHLALMSELLGVLPEHMRCGNGKFRSDFYTSRGELRHIKELKFWSLSDVLQEKYKFTESKAREIADFLEPMLVLDPLDRASATEMLDNCSDFFRVRDDDYSPFCYVSQDDDDGANSSRCGHEDDGDYADDESSDDDGEDDSETSTSSSEEGQEEEDEDEERRAVKEWLDNHPVLQPDLLGAQGLTLVDVQRAMRGEKMDTKKKQRAVEKVLAEL